MQESERRCPVTAAGRQFDPFAADYLQDPYPFLRALREQEPVFYSPELDYWIVARYEDVQNCFFDQERYSAKIALDTIVPPYPSTLSIMQKWALQGGDSMVNEDPPLHHTRRVRLSRAFSAQRIKAIEPFVRELTTGYIDRFIKRGAGDLIGEMAYELPALVVFRFFGVPDAEVEMVKAWAGPLAVFNWGRPSEAEQNRLADMLGAYWDYSRRHIRRLIAQPAGDGLGSDLAEAHREDPAVFSVDYLAGLLPNFLYAGHETTTSQSGNAFRILLEHPEQWQRLCADPSLIPNAVEECLRAVSSVIAWRRMTKVPVTIRGVEIPAGAKLLIYSGSANRDAEMFEAPERFDITRANARRHLSFGYGAHLCAGAPLARLEVRVMLEELARRLPHMELVKNQAWSYSPNTSFRGPKHVRVVWDPALNPLPADRP